jgi:hypothetical protein
VNCVLDAPDFAASAGLALDGVPAAGVTAGPELSACCPTHTAQVAVRSISHRIGETRFFFIAKSSRLSFLWH